VGAAEMLAVEVNVAAAQVVGVGLEQMLGLEVWVLGALRVEEAHGLCREEGVVGGVRGAEGAEEGEGASEEEH